MVVRQYESRPVLGSHVTLNAEEAVILRANLSHLSDAPLSF